MEEKDFRYNIPIDIFKGRKEGEWRIGGIASDQNSPDLQGEQVLVDGLDTSYLLQRGSFNWDHGKTPGDIIGEIDVAHKSDNSKLYVEGFLYPDVSKAKEVYNLLTSLSKAGSNRKLGLSIEGKIKERDESGKQIKKAWIKNVAVTYHPINQGTFVDFVKSLDGAELAFESAMPIHTDIKPEDSVAKATPRKRIAKSESTVSIGGLSYKLTSISESDDNTSSITQTIEKADPPEKDIKQDQKVYKYIGITPDQKESNSTGTQTGKTPSEEQLDGEKKVEKGLGVAAIAEVASKVGEVAGKIGSVVANAAQAGASTLGGGDAPVVSAPAETESAANTESVKKANPADEGAIIDESGIEEQERDENENLDNPEEAVAKAEGEGGSPSGVGLHAGVDNPATSGGVSGSALRTESLEKKKKVTTYDFDEKKKLGKSDVIGILSKTYPESIAKSLADLIFVLNNERATIKQFLKSDKVVQQLGELLKAIQVRGYVRSSHGGLHRVNPYSKDIAHEAMRLNTMGLGALLTRVKKINKPDKLLHFYAAAKVMGFDDVLPKAIAQRGMELGLRQSDFKNVHNQARIHVKNLTRRDMDAAYNRTHKPKAETNFQRGKDE